MTDLKPSEKKNSKNKSGLKAKILQTEKKKRECEKKALNLVVELIDGGLEEEVLLDKLSSINACHYEDIVEERFILKQCGYVMCNTKLTSIPKQQYKIVQNKVYDITERKKFCSNICYKSSIYLKSQLLTSPLWLRDTEIIPKFKLLQTIKPEINTNADDQIKPHRLNLDNKEKQSNEKLLEKIAALHL